MSIGGLIVDFYTRISWWWWWPTEWMDWCRVEIIIIICIKT